MGKWSKTTGGSVQRANPKKTIWFKGGNERKKLRKKGVPRRDKGFPGTRCRVNVRRRKKNLEMGTLPARLEKVPFVGKG